MHGCIFQIFSFSYSQKCSIAADQIFPLSENWSDEELQGMKVVLNDVKSQLNEFELLQWHEHTSNMNPVSSKDARSKVV